ncbi:unnamed protein product [Trichogramma brassicae]|uniref:Reverse transcriptase RNase H-like domain-containing protein n=1 Tax=Trichogramma brassicae TaxID=86971 RepID=A0A6H5HXR7_9HYME|nr:unnamed protein product [Trichogramma brassicae]
MEKLRFEFVMKAAADKKSNALMVTSITTPDGEIFDSSRPNCRSLLGLGAILKQIQENGEEKPVGYFSKKLNSAQKEKKSNFLECLAIKECLQYWQHLLLGRKFKVITDHKPLENLNIKSRTDEDLGDLTHYLISVRH